MHSLISLSNVYFCHKSKIGAHHSSMNGTLYVYIYIYTYNTRTHIQRLRLAPLGDSHVPMCKRVSIMCIYIYINIYIYIYIYIYTYQNMLIKHVYIYRSYGHIYDIYIYAIYICYIYIYIYGKCLGFAGPVMTTGDASSSSSSFEDQKFNEGGRIKPLLKIFNECRSLTRVGELNPY